MYTYINFQIWFSKYKFKNSKFRNVEVRSLRTPDWKHCWDFLKFSNFCFPKNIKCKIHRNGTEDPSIILILEGGFGILKIFLGRPKRPCLHSYIDIISPSLFCHLWLIPKHLGLGGMNEQVFQKWGDGVFESLTRPGGNLYEDKIWDNFNPLLQRLRRQ